MRASHYAKAIYALSSSGEGGEDVVSRAIGTVVQNGHAHLFPKILKSLNTLIARHQKDETIEVTTATDLLQEQVAQLLRKEPFSTILSVKHKRVLRKVDPSIIGGAIARTNTTRIDASYKNMLVQTYQNMTNHL